MKKTLMLIKYFLLRVHILLHFQNRVKVGVTASVFNIPRFNVRKGNIFIEKHCSLKTSVISSINGGQIRIGENTSIGRNDIIVSHGNITIGRNCSLAPNVCIYDHDHKFGKNGKESGFKIGKVTIGDNVWCGVGVIILRDTVIGNNCVIGAGTVVKGNIPDNSLVVGSREMIIKPLHE